MPVVPCALQHKESWGDCRARQTKPVTLPRIRLETCRGHARCTLLDSVEAGRELPRKPPRASGVRGAPATCMPQSPPIHASPCPLPGHTHHALPVRAQVLPRRRQPLRGQHLLQRVNVGGAGAHVGPHLLLHPVPLRLPQLACGGRGGAGRGVGEGHEGRVARPPTQRCACCDALCGSSPPPAPAPRSAAPAAAHSAAARPRPPPLTLLCIVALVLLEVQAQGEDVVGLRGRGGRGADITRRSGRGGGARSTRLPARPRRAGGSPLRWRPW